MQDDFITNINNLYGDSGKKWLDSLPEKIKFYEQKWDLSVKPPYKLTYNYVAPIEYKNGKSGVIKIGYLQDNEFQNEVESLKVFNGNGVVKLITEDKKNAVIIVELIQPGTTLSTLKDDIQCTRIIASLIKKIRTPLPANHRFITIFEWTRELYEYPNFNIKENIPKIPSDFIKLAIKLFEELISTSENTVLTHADLHHDNILSSGENEWKAIDPKGIAADPVYETAAMIRNPYKQIRNEKNLEKLFQNRIKILTEELGFDPQRILKWCIAQTILSGVWSRGSAEYTLHALKVAKALNNLRVKY